MTTETQVAPDIPQDVPQGFEPLFRKSPLTEPWEPL
ncbi:hypothetical protein ACVINW_002900 [Bradyrhizobium sp. USDA 4461]